MIYISLPIKLLHEAQGHFITIELKNGLTIRGHLLDAEDNMNLQIKNPVITHRSGRIVQSEHVYIRGSQVRFIVFPDLLKHAPMFGEGVRKGRGIGLGRGKATVARAQASKVQDKTIPSAGRGDGSGVRMPGGANRYYK